MAETNKYRSNLFLILAIAAAVAVTLWIILSFDNQSSRPQEGFGQGKIKSIMVAEGVIVNKHNS